MTLILIGLATSMGLAIMQLLDQYWGDRDWVLLAERIIHQSVAVVVVCFNIHIFTPIFGRSVGWTQALVMILPAVVSAGSVFAVIIFVSLLWGLRLIRGLFPRYAKTKAV